MARRARRQPLPPSKRLAAGHGPHRTGSNRSKRPFELTENSYNLLVWNESCVTYRAVVELDLSPCVVEACIPARLVGGEGLAVNASLFVADANKQRSIPPERSRPILPSRGTRQSINFTWRLSSAMTGQDQMISREALGQLLRCNAC